MEAKVHHRPKHALPATALPWLSLRDHFIATVGAAAGQGARRGPLLVLADATFAPRSRFPLHPHRDMEILSVVVQGALSHHGDQAHGAVLPARSAQLLSARDGVVHAEGNDADAPTHMLQLWFEPTARGGAPVYTQRDLSKRGRQLVAGDEGMPLRCDARVWWVDVAPHARERLELAQGRLGYLLGLDGAVVAGGVTVAPGDGLEVGPGDLDVTGGPASAAVLWIDTAG